MIHVGKPTAMILAALAFASLTTASARAGSSMNATILQKQKFVNSLIEDGDKAVARNLAYIAKQDGRIADIKHLQSITPTTPQQAAAIAQSIRMDQLSICHLQKYLDASKVHLSTVGLSICNRITATLDYLKKYAPNDPALAAYIARTEQRQMAICTSFNTIITRPSASAYCATP